MRKNTKSVYDSWVDNRSKRGDSISTDGTTIYSYQTPILSIEDGKLTLNGRHYSSTTSRQQNDLRYLLERDGREYVERS